MGKGSGTGVRWDIPDLPKLDPQRIAIAAAKVVADKLVARLRSGTVKAQGLARWLADRVEVQGNVVTWPHSAAVERLGLADVDRAWLAEAMQQALKEEQQQR